MYLRMYTDLSTYLVFHLPIYLGIDVPMDLWVCLCVGMRVCVCVCAFVCVYLHLDLHECHMHNVHTSVIMNASDLQVASIL